MLCLGGFMDQENTQQKSHSKSNEELLEEFNETMVEPRNFTRAEILEDDCLSYL